MKATDTVTRAVSERLSGDRPSVFRAAATAAVVGAAVGATVYRALRN